MLLPAFLLLVIVLLLFLLWRARTQRPAPSPAPSPPPPGPSQAPTPGQISNQFDAATLAKALAVRLVGNPADGSRATMPREAGPVIWVDQGDEVLVHLEAMQIEMQDGLLLVSVDLETDQTGRTPLIVSIALGKSNDGAGLLAVTDEYPRGNGILAARWGSILQEGVWASLLGLAKDHAMQTGQAPRTIEVVGGQLTFQPGNPLVASTSS